MSRYEGSAAIRRVYTSASGVTVLDVNPTGLGWQWALAPTGQDREALAIALAAMTGGWRLYLALPDNAASNVLDLVGLTKEADVG